MSPSPDVLTHLSNKLGWKSATYEMCGQRKHHMFKLCWLNFFSPILKEQHLCQPRTSRACPHIHMEKIENEIGYWGEPQGCGDRDTRSRLADEGDADSDRIIQKIDNAELACLLINHACELCKPDFSRHTSQTLIHPQKGSIGHSQS